MLPTIFTLELRLFCYSKAIVFSFLFMPKNIYYLFILESSQKSDSFDIITFNCDLQSTCHLIM